eukprot:TRINITY_DN19980_c0_g1_i1.p1 TRINITY_DN19980_c0_g1~~TRINITY_DN19980_c0_g1_i1.p1  ORF type:complete len:929 (+),score=169.34 TRINITY_DN19980_c0_g1_i1:82-2868(+)
MSVDQLFERTLSSKRADQSIHTAAVALEGNELTWALLDTKTSTLACVLRNSEAFSDGGIENGVVAVLAERTLALVVGLLGVWRAGAAYVPVEPSYPEARRRTILEDSGAHAIIALEGLLATGDGADLGLRIELGLDGDVCLPAGVCASAKFSSDRVEGNLDRLAYIIFTSGSTGRPKGVAATHSPVVNVLQAFHQMFLQAHGPGRGPLLAVSSFAFDISVLEIFWPLAFGFGLILAPKQDVRNGKGLQCLLMGAKAGSLGRPSILQATPSTWQMLLQSGWQGNKELHALCGGEPFHASLSSLPSMCASLRNVYGPTEATIWASSFLAENLHIAERLPIGRPLQNVTFALRPARGKADEVKIERPHCEIGELLIGGQALARGYHNQPDLTAEVFVNCADGRQYITGDLALMRPDGQYEHLGRLDFQIKLRGHRIELEEIEACLLKDPLVSGSAVVVGTGPAGAPALVAFVVLHDNGTRLDIHKCKSLPAELLAQLRSRCRATLPHYMQPWVIMQIRDLPLSNSGKLDRTVLLDISATLDEVSPLPPLSVPSDSVGTDEATAVRKAFAWMGIDAEDADDSSDLDALGADSLGLVPFLQALPDLLPGLKESSWDPVEDGVPAALARRTIGAFASYLREVMGGNSHAGHESTRTESSLAPQKNQKKQKAQNQKSQQQKPSQHADQSAGYAGATPSSPEDDPGLAACQRGDTAALEQQLQQGWNPVTTVDRFGSPGLHWAASGGYLDVCKLLVEWRADPGQQDKKSGRCALHWAARQGHLELCKWLCTSEGQVVDTLTKDSTTALQLAAWGGFIQVAEWLVEQGANLDHLNKYVCTAIHFASLNGQLEMTKWLHQKGLSLTLGNQQDHHALHKAAYGGHKDLCLWLQDEMGIDREAVEPDKRGQTSVDLARKAGHEELANWLMRHRGQCHLAA